MARTISIGAQGFEDLRTNGYFYVDKTGFVRDWWASGDQVTLVCRPRRFGKTLNLDTVHCFFSTEFAGRGEERWYDGFTFGGAGSIYSPWSVAWPEGASPCACLPHGGHRVSASLAQSSVEISRTHSLFAELPASGERV